MTQDNRLMEVSHDGPIRIGHIFHGFVLTVKEFLGEFGPFPFVVTFFLTLPKSRMLGCLPPQNEVVW